LSYKEKQEFQQLERDIEALTLEKAAAEEALSSGMLSVEEITKLSARFQVVTQQLDEKEMRWLELSEYA
jgi:ATP-binding cassette subfamily F protein uup